MLDFYMGQIILWAGAGTPQGMLPCDGRSLQISANQALFGLLGTKFGGDGTTNFNLPDLRGRVPVGAGVSALSGRSYAQGEKAGEEKSVLTAEHMPAHTHAVTGCKVAGSVGVVNNRLSSAGMSGVTPLYNIYADGTDLSKRVALAGGNLTRTGQGLAHDNMQPHLALSFLMVVQGLYPSRNT